MIKNSLIGFLFIIAFNVFSQPNIAIRDSIENVLTHAKTDTATCFKLLNFVEILSPAEHETAVRISKWVVKASKKNGDKKCMAQSLFVLGRSYQIIDDFKTATHYFTQAAKLAEQYNFYGMQIALYTCFANTYSAVKQYQLAEDYYYKAIQISKKHKLKRNLATIYFNLASLQYESKPDSNYVSNALQNTNAALSLADEKENWDVIAYSLWIKALIYEQKLKNDSSVIFLDQAFSIAKKHDMVDFYPAYYSSKGQKLKEQKKYKQAIEMYLLGLKEAERAHSQLWQYNFYGELADVAARNNDFKKAYEYYHSYKMYYDSVVNTQNFNKLNEAETQLKFERKNKELLKAKKDKEISKLLLQKAKQQEQNLWILIISIGIIVLILLLFLVVLVRTTRLRKEAYIKLQQKNIEIQQQSEQLAHLSGQITKYQTQMNPHFIFNALNSIQGFVVNNEKEKSIQQLSNFSKLMRATLNNSNHAYISIANELDYLKTYIAFEQERFKNKIEFKIILNVNEKETMILPMMIQPLLENALKHARLGDVEDACIRLELSEEMNMLKVTVYDNGKGININKNDLIKQSHSFSILQSRIKLAFESEKMKLPDTYFLLKSIPEIVRGTYVEFYLPMITEF